MRKEVHNILENKLQEIGLSEAKFVQNRLRMRNFPNVSRTKPFFVKPYSIQQKVQMNVVQLEVRMSKELTTSSSKLRLINAILQIPIIVSQEQPIRFLMLEITIVTYKLGQQFEPLIRSQLENGQVTYQVLVSIQVGR